MMDMSALSLLFVLLNVLFRVLVNVVKYKLDHMRRRIETDERDSTNRASFRCPCCFSTFTDLEANQLFDPMTGKHSEQAVLTQLCNFIYCNIQHA